MEINWCKKLLLFIFPLAIGIVLVMYHMGIFVTRIEPSYDALEDTNEGVAYEGFLGIQVTVEDSIEVSEKLSLYLCDEGGVIFAPSFMASTERGRIYFNEKEFEIELSGKKVKNGDGIILCREYQNLSVKSVPDNALIYKGHLTCLKSENIPSVFITTTEHGLDWVDSAKENREKAEFVCVKADGKVDCAGEMVFHTRGSSSFTRCRKKSYRVNFEDDIDILSMGKRESYVLQANAFDQSKLRNLLAYKMAQNLGMPDVCEVKPVDLFVDGRYLGNYEIMECIDVDDYAPDRADKKADYLIGINTWKKTSGILAPENATEEEEEKIDRLVENMRHLISSCSSKEDYEALGQVIDLDSLANMYIMNFLTDDSDANARSTYYHITEDKIYAGPAWDYDRTFGLMAKSQRDICLNSFDAGVPEIMAENLNFRAELCHRAENLDIEELKTFVDSEASDIAQSVSLDKVRWSGKEISFMYFDNGECVGHSSDSDREESFVCRGDIQKEAEYIESNLEDKYQLMCQVLNHRQDYAKIMIDDNLYGRVYWVKRGHVINEDFINWLYDLYYVDRLEYEDKVQLMPGDIINEDTLIYTGTGGKFAGKHSSGF